MCGIAGIWSADERKHSRLSSAVRQIAHRGPDGRGFYRDGTLSLGHARLAIIDAEGGAQPMQSGDLVVIFNGMIFNHADLRSDLKRLGAHFKSNCDTEVLLHGYRFWGIRGLLDRLNGMFAFALYDQSAQILILARDRLGEKPLYYSSDGDCFAFASEIKGVCALTDCDEPRIPEDWFVLESSLSDDTLYHGVRCFRPAHFMILCDGVVVAYERYWSIPKETDRDITHDEAAQKLRELICDAVRIRTISDVPVSLFLSGGLDSSLIACIAKPDVVFSAGYPDFVGKFCEFDHARAVAKHIGAELVETTMRREDVKGVPEMLGSILRSLDQPISTSSTLTAFRLARCARERGFKVILNGQGSDEFFGGYARYALLKHERDLSENPFYQQYTPMARRLWGESLFTDPAARYLAITQRATPKTRSALNFYQVVMRDFERLELVSQLGVIDALTTMQDLIVMDDRACASVGIESRSPFLDHRVVEFAARLPDRLKIVGETTKVVLRAAARGIVPDSVIDRADKMGMVSPIGVWLKHELSDWASEKTAWLKQKIPDLPNAEPGDYDRRLHAQVMMALFLGAYEGQR